MKEVKFTGDIIADFDQTQNTAFPGEGPVTLRLRRASCKVSEDDACNTSISVSAPRPTAVNGTGNEQYRNIRHELTLNSNLI
jgi:hypothetical protein